MNDKNKIKIRINAYKIVESDVVEDFTLKQQIATAMIIPNQLYDFELDDFGDYLTLTINEEHKDKALKILEQFKREVIII
jgi:hypothetical protein